MTRGFRTLFALLLCAASAPFAGACSSLLPRDLPDAAPPLVDMEEPLTLQAEPDDEAARRALDLGGFTGVDVKDARASLDDTDPGGVSVRRVVENSPGDAAGVVEGDLLLEVRDAKGATHVLEWPSEWRRVELEARAGDRLQLKFDRAGVTMEASVTVTPRVRGTDRQDAERFREERRVGVVLRTATEVEARAAGLGPGGGAVIVGLSRRSPWRDAGLRFGDLLTRVGDKQVAHPQAVLDVIRAAEDDAVLPIRFVRKGQSRELDVALSERAAELTEFSLPLLFSYENDRGTTETSVLLGLVRHRATEVAWEWRILFFIRIAGGEADRLVGEEPR